MRRRAFVAMALVLVMVMVVSPAYALKQTYTSGDLVVNYQTDHVGAVFRNSAVPDERYVFQIPMIVEFRDVDNSGNLTLGDLVVAVAPLDDLSYNVQEGDGYVNITRTGDVKLKPTMETAHIEVYLTISNSTANEAKRGIMVDRPRVSSNDSLAMIVIFSSVDASMVMHQAQRKYQHQTKAELQMKAGSTQADITYENTCTADGQQKNVNVYAYERSYERKHKFNYDGQVATQVIFPYGSTIVYDPEISVEKVSFFTSTSFLATVIAVLLVIFVLGAIAHNRKR